MNKQARKETDMPWQRFLITPANGEPNPNLCRGYCSLLRISFNPIVSRLTVIMELIVGLELQLLSRS